LCEFAYVVFESGYHRWEVVDGEESLLSKQGVPYDVARVSVVGLPHVLCERTVLREFDDGTGLSELWGLCSLGVYGTAGVSVAAPAERSRWSVENLTMEGSSWYISGFG
jgi:hypothetical protein